MLCKYPFVSTAGTFGCGQCFVCRLNQSRKWALRVALEQRVSVDTIFITLTYDQEHCPSELSKDDAQKFLKRLRKKHKFRYYLCGEYGTKTKRPHYHAMLYFPYVVEFPDFYHDLANSWKFGRTNARRVSDTNTSRYVSKYVTKKATQEYDEDRPEWHLASRQPGLGSTAVQGICEQLVTYGYFKQSNDVPHEMLIDGKRLPIDRYLKTLMREYMEEKYGFIADPRSHGNAVRQSLEEIWEDFRCARLAGKYLGDGSPVHGVYADFSRFTSDQSRNRRARLINAYRRRKTQL